MAEIGSSTKSRIMRRVIVSDERVSVGRAETAKVALASIASVAPTPDYVQSQQELRRLNAHCAAQDERLQRLQAELDQASAALRDLGAQRDQQWSDAQERGYQDGRARAEQQVRQELESSIAAWIRSAEQAAHEHERQLQSVRADLTQIVTAAVSKLLGDGLLNPSGIRAALEQALKEAGVTAQARILIAPAQYEQLMKPGTQFMASLRERRLEVAADARVSCGGCLLEVPHGIVDARFEVQLEQLRQILAAHGTAGDGK